MKLKNCKCGNIASKYPDTVAGDNKEELKMIYCDKCNLSTVSWATWNDAIKNWNHLVKKEKVGGGIKQNGKG